MALPARQSTIPLGQPSIEFIDDASRIRDANVRQFLELWRAAHIDGRAPDKSFLDPLRLRFLLGSLSLLEAEPNPPHFRYRLIGTDIVRRLGLDLAGKGIDQYPDDVLRPFLIKGVTMVHRAARPVYAYVKARTHSQDWLLEVVAVPLLGADGEVTHIGSGQSFPPGKTEQSGHA